jgi:probable addiction module antidote protein
MGKTKTKPFDAADYLDNPEVIAAYLTEAFETGDAEFIAAAIGDVARAKGMSGVAKEAGVSRESLYRSLGVKGNPEFDTVVRVMDALGMQILIEPKSRAAA